MLMVISPGEIKRPALWLPGDVIVTMTDNNICNNVCYDVPEIVQSTLYYLQSLQQLYKLNFIITILQRKNWSLVRLSNVSKVTQLL